MSGESIERARVALVSHAVMFHTGGTKFYEITVISSESNDQSMVIFRYGRKTSYGSGGQIDIRDVSNKKDAHTIAIINHAQPKIKEKAKNGYAISARKAEIPESKIKTIHNRYSEDGYFDENNAGWKLDLSHLRDLKTICEERAGSIPILELMPAIKASFGDSVAQSVREVVGQDTEIEMGHNVSLTSIPATVGDGDGW